MVGGDEEVDTPPWTGGDEGPKDVRVSTWVVLRIEVENEGSDFRVPLLTNRGQPSLRGLVCLHRPSGPRHLCTVEDGVNTLT